MTSKSLSRLIELAESGNVKAQIRLAEMYKRGSREVTRDIGTSLRRHTRAAESGHWRYQESLALRFLWCEEKHRDLDFAFLWLKRAAEGGSVEAAYLLGGEYAVGDNVPYDPAEAAKWYELAAYSASPEPAAQYSLGQMYLDGEGVAKGVQKGKVLFEMAAKNGDDVAAQFLADDLFGALPRFRERQFEEPVLEAAVCEVEREMRPCVVTRRPGRARRQLG